jgi:hypothetical protein
MTSPLRGFAVLAIAIAAATPSIAQTCNTANRSVLLVLDASGSMNAKLPSGEARIDIARGAIKRGRGDDPGRGPTCPQALWVPVAAR